MRWSLFALYCIQSSIYQAKWATSLEGLLWLVQTTQDVLNWQGMRLAS